LFGNPDAADQAIDILPASPSADERVVLYPQAFEPSTSDKWLAQLSDQLAWEQRTITLFGKTHLQPRLVAWYGDRGARYRYSRQTLEPMPWVEPLSDIRQRCEAYASAPFNGVLCNLYRDGEDAMGWHADNEPELGEQPTIASVSLGVPRRFDLRHRATGVTIRTELPHGSLLIMSGRTQENWLHQIPRSKRVSGLRINLTFRWVDPDFCKN
jgi:alkylated DNA repair dioxygenase AlkB